jgi:branched-chain amino acid aminotransferase
VTHAWIDGQLVDAEERWLRVTDRGFQLGDGVFETLRTRRGWPIELDEHLARLAESAAALAIQLDDDAGDVLTRAIHELLDADELATADAALRITVSRGSLPGRGMLPPGWRDARPSVVVQAWPYRPPSAELLERGARAITSALRKDPSSRLAGVKTTSRADHVFARLEAERAGVDEALFLTIDGHVAEATSANVFAIAGEDLATPPRSAGILSGTTRSWLLGHAGAEGLRPVERDLGRDEVLGADEAFLTSSVAGIVPLVELDRQPIGGGRPGPRTAVLRETRERWIEDQVTAGAPWTAPS